MYGIPSSLGSSITGDIIHLNVGGTRFKVCFQVKVMMSGTLHFLRDIKWSVLLISRFSTSRQTLTSFPDTFFTSLLSGRISSLKDETGAIFIDRDPALFSTILGYMRSKEIDLSGKDLHMLKHEAEFYGITPLVRRLQLCEELTQTTCGGVLFHGIISAPVPPFPTTVDDSEKRRSMSSADIELSARTSLTAAIESLNLRGGRGVMDLQQSYQPAGSVTDLRFNRNGAAVLAGTVSNTESPLRVTIIKGHFNWLAVAYPHFVSLYRLKESIGWNLAWTSPHIDAVVEHIALNAKVITPGQDSCSRMLAVNHSSYIQLWQISDNGQSTREVGTFNLSASIDSLFFIGCHLVALSNSGKFGVWHAMTQNWQIQDIKPITSYDTTGSFLLLGCDNGSIYNIDMQKFPLRMKDNDLLVTELYKDPTGDKITALSVYIPPRTNQQYVGLSGSWIEIAYGTSTGMVRIIYQHPETVGQGPQLFQTFSVHCSPVTKVMISEKHLVSVCSEYNHVRTWSVTRFRGMISTQPGSMPLSSFKVLSVEDASPPLYYSSGNDIGPYGEKDDHQVFIQKVVPNSDQLFVRLSCSGKRICVIKSVDNTTITSFTIHECEGSTRMGSRPRRYLFTGHSNGTVQTWDLSTALDMNSKGTACVEDRELGGPSASELIHLVDQCDLSTSTHTTPSPSPHLLPSNLPSARSSVYGGGAEGGPASHCDPRNQYSSSQSLYSAAAATSDTIGQQLSSCSPKHSAAVQQSAAATPQLLRRQFLEQRSHISPLGVGVNNLSEGGGSGSSHSGSSGGKTTNSS